MEEGLDTGEVLRRHRESLTECAQRHGLLIEEYYPEVVSGESLYARPQMLRLLEAVEAGRYGAVLCMDLDRLSRGRMKDQGIILDAFKDTNTLIVTPDKVYDLSDEIDDELAEFKTFLSRREYKIINKRLRRGLERSIREGCYVANAPYGYKKVSDGRRPTLEIYEPEAKFVRLMYQMYANGCGCASIAGHVNAMGARPRRSAAFTRSSVANILRNPTYAGKIVWNRTTRVKGNGRSGPRRAAVPNPPERWTVADGLHPPIIERALYDAVQEILSGKYRPARGDGTIKSPLAGLAVCAHCGGGMQRIPLQGQPYLLCHKKGCCAAAKLDLVEARLIRHLEAFLAGVQLERPERRRDLTPLEQALKAVTRELNAAVRQKERLHELLELGEYDLPTYRARMAAVAEKARDLERRRDEAQRRLARAASYAPDPQAPQVRTVLDVYRASDAAHRNALLHAVIETAVYRKEKKTRPAAFELDFTLKAR